MAEDDKKVSFGFAKSIKKPTLVKQVLQEEKKVDYIECVDEKVIKVIGKKEKEEKEPLVIPLLGPKTWRDVLIQHIKKRDAGILEPKTANENNTQTIKVKEEPKEISNGDVTLVKDNIPNVQIKTEPPDESKSKTLTLEEQAAKEIIEDFKSKEQKENELSNLTLPVTEGQNVTEVEECTLADYEKVPVHAFGLALLRGMGWKPDKEDGKNKKVLIVPRPKGMGLGADRVIMQKQKEEKSQREEEELSIEKGSFIKIIIGRQSNAYGQIEGLDEDAGRLIVKMALGGNIISVNESTVRAVTKAEYLKNSKVLNATKYEEYKSKEGTSKKRPVSPESFDNSDNSNSDTFDRRKSRKEDDDGYKSKKSSKKSKRKRDASDSDNDGKKRSRRRRSSSNETHGTKRAKKSKKHKGRDKERERRKERKSRYSESPKRRNSKKHRSRSSSRR